MLPSRPLPDDAVLVTLGSVKSEVSPEAAAFVIQSEHLKRKMHFLGISSEWDFSKESMNFATSTHLKSYRSIFRESWDTVINDFMAQPVGEKQLEYGKIFVSGPSVLESGCSYDMRLDMAFGIFQSDEFERDYINILTRAEMHLFKFTSGHREETEENIAAVVDLLKLRARQSYFSAKAYHTKKWKEDAARDARTERIARRLRMFLTPRAASNFGKFAIFIYDYCFSGFLGWLFGYLRGLIRPFMLSHHAGLEAVSQERELSVATSQECESPVAKLSGEEKKRLCAARLCNTDCECFRAKKSIAKSAPMPTAVISVFDGVVSRDAAP